MSSIFELDGQYEPCSFCLSIPTHQVDSQPTSLSATITHPSTGEVANISGAYEGTWPVCEPCLELIRDEDWDGLVNRALQRTLLIFTDALVRMRKRERFKLIGDHRRNQLNTSVSSVLTIVGGTLQAVGVLVVFAELAAIRAHEFHKPAPWTRARRWLRARLRRRQVIQVEGVEDSSVAESVRAKVRQGALATDATEAERITWLEQYVKQLDDALDRMWETINRERDAAISEAERELREEHEAREAQRRDQLNRSMIRQAFGAICLFFGVVLTTISAVA